MNSTISRRQNGFTLIEIMVVVVILGILAAIVVPNIMAAPDKARIAKAQQDLRVIEAQLDQYKLDNFVYPTTQQGLQALVSAPTVDPKAPNWQPGGYLKSLPKDPWDNEYQYISPGNHGSYDLFSLGADGKPGGTGSDADIVNWVTPATGS